MYAELVVHECKITTSTSSSQVSTMAHRPGSKGVEDEWLIYGFRRAPMSWTSSTMIPICKRSREVVRERI